MEQNRDNSSKSSAESEMHSSSLRVWLVRYRKHLLWAPLVLCAVVALFAPIDVLQFSAAKTIVNIAASLVPMIDRLDAQFELTQVAQLYYSMMWMSLPIIYYSLDVGDREDLVSRLQSNKALFWLIIVFCLFVWVGILYMLSYVSPDPLGNDGRDVLMLRSRLGMATSGGVIIASLAALPKFVIRTASCFRDIYNQGELK